MNNAVKHTRRTEAQIRSLLNLQAENNNLTVTEFCRINKIHKANFYNWRNKYGVDIAEPAQFIPVHLNDAVPDVTLFAEIEFSSKVKVRLFQKVDAAYFKALLK
jgi:hypothetical protein